MKNERKYLVPINPTQDQLDEYNKKYGTDYRSMEEHIQDMFDKIIEQMEEMGGWYIGDAIEVEVKVKYISENK